MIGTALLTLGLVIPGRTDLLTLDQALNQAMKNAFSLRIAQSQIEKAKQTERQAKGIFGPSVTLNGNYSRFDGAVQGGGSGSGDTTTASVTVSQILDIVGVNKKAADASRLVRMAAEAGFGAEANSLKLAVRTAYFNVLLSESLVKVQQDFKTSAQTRYDKAKIRFDEGGIPRFDVLRFENDLRKAEQAVVQAEGGLKTAKQALNNAISRPIETEFDVQGPVELPRLPDDPSSLVVAAIKNRHEVKQTEYRIDSLEYVAEAQSGGLKPSLIVQATHTRNIDPFPGQGSQGTSGAIVLSFPVFDSGITQAKVESARQDKEQAKIGFEQLLLGIALEVRTTHTQAMTAKRALDVAMDGERLAAEALRLAQIRYDEGAGILVDVIQSQADYTAAQGSVQTQKYAFLTAIAALEKATGIDGIGNQP